MNKKEQRNMQMCQPNEYVVDVSERSRERERERALPITCIAVIINGISVYIFLNYSDSEA